MSIIVVFFFFRIRVFELCAGRTFGLEVPLFVCVGVTLEWIGVDVCDVREGMINLLREVVAMSE